MDDKNMDALPPVDPGMEQNLKLPESDNNSLSPHEKESAQALEQSPSGFVNPSASVMPVADLSLSQIPQTDDSTNTPSVNDQSTQHLIADDMDLIEKEWVQKAKQIVEQTRHDPHLQNEEITKIKADYLRKRYGRDLKTGS